MLTINIADCGVPSSNSHVLLFYNSTMEGSIVIYQCMEGLLPNITMNAACQAGGVWIPNPAMHTCSTPDQGQYNVFGSLTDNHWYYTL